MKLSRRSDRRATGGFTLAEVAVTILIVGLALTMILQGLNNAKLRAARTRNLKQARELALLTVGEIASGLWWEELEGNVDHLGPFAYEDYPDYTWEVVLGDSGNFYEAQDNPDAPFDNWAYKEQVRRDAEDFDEQADEEEKKPFEKLRIKVTYPKVQDAANEFELERWIRWEQVYGVDEEQAQDQQQDGESGTPEDADANS